MNNFYRIACFCRARRGFTLTEIAIVLGVAGFITSLIWGYASNVWENQRVTAAQQQMIKSVSNIRDTYMGRQSWSQSAGTDITQTLDNISNGIGLFPTEMRVVQTSPGATALNHALSTTTGGSTTCQTSGGSFCVLVSPLSQRYFRMAFLGLTQSTCIKFLMGLPIGDAAIGMMNLFVNNTSTAKEAYTLGANTWSPALPYSGSTVSGWCSNSGQTNEIDIDFKLH